MLTLQELQKEAKKHRAEYEPVTRTVRVVSTTADIDKDTLLCSGVAPSTAAGKSYDLVLLFHDVTFALEPNPLTPVRLETRVRNRGPRTVLYSEQMDETKHPVQVRCECQDFHMTWAFWTEKEGSLYGPVKPYVRKTTTRPSRNPENVAGCCKHLISFIDVLRDQKLLAPESP